jgi:hypothetical protein
VKRRDDTRDWHLKLNAPPPVSLNEEGSCAICQAVKPVYVDKNEEFQVCLRCRFIRQEASPGVSWKVKLVEL